jgi:hypothetical protein
MPTRVDVTAAKSSDPLPSWRDDVDDEPASARPASTGVAGGTADPAPGTPAPSWPTFQFGDTVLDKPASFGTAEASRTADEAPTSWGDPWKPARAGSGSGSDRDVAVTGSPADDGDTGTGFTADAGSQAEDAGDADETADSGRTAHVSPGTADSGEGEGEGEAEADAGDTRAASAAREVTVVPGVPRYHDPNCILIRFMPDDDVHRMTVPEAEKAGCTPCSACQAED